MDGYAKRDDGLMVGAVHTVQTIELLRQIKRGRFIPVRCISTRSPTSPGSIRSRECETNIQTVRRMIEVVDRLDAHNGFNDAIDRQDAVASQAMLQELMLGR